MILRDQYVLMDLDSVPRIRGDDPQAVRPLGVNVTCSPHPRG